MRVIDGGVFWPTTDWEHFDGLIGVWRFPGTDHRMVHTTYDSRWVDRGEAIHRAEPGARRPTPRPPAVSALVLAAIQRRPIIAGLAPDT
jgi:hypothetical protein